MSCLRFDHGQVQGNWVANLHKSLISLDSEISTAHIAGGNADPSVGDVDAADV